MARWPLLAGVPQDDVQRVIALARRRRFARGEVVFHGGDPGDSLHLVVRGRFAARVTTPLGDTATLALVGPGEAFGELALLLPDHRHTTTVQSLDEGETLSVYQPDFEALRRRHPEVGEVIIHILAERVARLTERLVEALYTPADRRVLARLDELAAQARLEGGGEISVRLTQEDLAGLAGVSRVTVNRVLRAEAHRGRLRLGRGVITVDVGGRAPGT